MSRKKENFPSDQISLLKALLQQTFGKSIKKSVDCEHLSNHIKSTTKEYISAQTIRRIFGFIDSPFSPSHTNLNIFSKYCGYRNWEDLISCSSSKTFRQILSEDEASLYLNFFKIKVTEEKDINYHNASKNIAERILRNEDLFNQLAAPLAENQTSQIFFYERSPFIDGLGTYYPRGIRLYLIHKKDTQAQIFGLSLLLLGAFLTENYLEIKEVYQKLSRCKIQKDFHPFIIARYLGSKILYKKLFKENIDPELKQVHEYAGYFSSPSKINFWHLHYYQFMIMDYLNLVELFDESLLVQSTIKKNKFFPYIGEHDYIEAWEIINQITMYKKNPKEFLNWLKSFEKKEFNSFMFRKYYRIQLLIAALSTGLLNKSRHQSFSLELKELISATKFTFFEKRLIN